MADKCTECGQVISKAETLEEIFAAFKKHMSPYSWAAHYPKTDWEDVPNLGKVRIVDLSETFHEDPGYGELRVYMVFEVANKGFYRVEGEKSSYDGTRWDTVLFPVQKQKREIWVYE